MAKCIRAPRGSKSAHNLSRAIIETLPTQILSPVFVVNEWQRNSFAIITDYKDQNKNHMLIALKLLSEVQNLSVREKLAEYEKKAHFRNADRECRQTQKEHPLEH